MARFQVDMDILLAKLESHKKHVEDQFFTTNEKFEEPEKNLKEMEERITTRFQSIIDHLLTRLGTHENKVEEEFRKVDEKLQEPLFKLIEAEERITGLFQSILARFQSRLVDNENNIEAKFRRMESRLEEPETRLTITEERISQLEIVFEQVNHTTHQIAVVPPVIYLQHPQETVNVTQSACPERSPSLPRTCFDLRKSDPKLPSGLYWIDPDGEKIGEPPIQVFCNMTSGTFF